MSCVNYRCYHCLPENVITSGLRRFRAHLRAVHGVQHPSADESNGFRINGSVPQSRDPRHQTVGSPNNPVNQLQQLQGTVNLSTDQHHQATLPVPNASGSDHQPVVSHPTVLASGNWLPPGPPPILGDVLCRDAPKDNHNQPENVEPIIPIESGCPSNSHGLKKDVEHSMTKEAINIYAAAGDVGLETTPSVQANPIDISASPPSTLNEETKPSDTSLEFE